MGAYYQDYAAEKNKILSDGDTSNDWKATLLEAARQEKLQNIIEVMNECYTQPTILVNKIILSGVGELFRLNMCEEILGLTPPIRCRGAFLIDEPALRSLQKVITEQLAKIDEDREAACGKK